MTPEKVLARAPKILTQSERESYFAAGYLLKERFVGDAWLARLREVTEQMIDESRNCSASNDKFDVEKEHGAAAPKLRRLTQPVEHDPAYWQFAANSMITDLAEDLLGADVKFHHSKLNFKWFGGGVRRQRVHFPPVTAARTKHETHSTSLRRSSASVGHGMCAVCTRWPSGNCSLGLL